MVVNHDRAKGVIVNTEETNPHSTAMIVSSYVRHHTLRPEQLSDLNTTVHNALGQLGQPVATEEALGIAERSSAHRPGLFRAPFDVGKGTWARSRVRTGITGGVAASSTDAGR